MRACVCVFKNHNRPSRLSARLRPSFYSSADAFISLLPNDISLLFPGPLVRISVHSEPSPLCHRLLRLPPPDTDKRMAAAVPGSPGRINPNTAMNNNGPFSACTICQRGNFHCLCVCVCLCGAMTSYSYRCKHMLVVFLNMIKVNV